MALDEELRLVADAGIAVAVIDQSGRLASATPALEELIGEPLEHSLSWADTLPLYGDFGNVMLRPEDLPIAVALRNGTGCDAIVTMRCTHRTLRHHHWSARPLRSPSGRGKGALAVVVDMTAPIEAARRRLDVDLAMSVSHQLRTPLTAIVGYAELMEDADLTQEARGSSLAAIRRACDRLDRVVAWLCEQL